MKIIQVIPEQKAVSLRYTIENVIHYQKIRFWALISDVSRDGNEYQNLVPMVVLCDDTFNLSNHMGYQAFYVPESGYHNIFYQEMRLSEIIDLDFGDGKFVKDFFVDKTVYKEKIIEISDGLSPHVKQFFVGGVDELTRKITVTENTGE